MNRESAKLPALSHMEFHKDVTEVTFEKLWPEREAAQVGTGAKIRPNGKQHLIKAHAGKVAEGCTLAPTEKWKEAEEKYRFIVTRVQGSQDSKLTSVLYIS
jgi:hypothetical protein